MSAPRRWLDDPNADDRLRDVLREASGARSLDPVTRRRLRAKVARAASVPVVAAGWVFVKSAAAALGVVLGGGAIAVATGVVEWSPRPAAAPAAVASPAAPARPRPPAPVALPSAGTPEAEASPPKLNPLPSLPLALPSASSSGGLAAEAALLEQARRDMRRAPAAALVRALDHARRFPRGQLAAERTLIQIEALHRLNRDAEARLLARSLVAGSGLYAERVRQLLGENVQ